MPADIEKCRCGSEKIAVVILAASHHHPCVVEKRIVFFAFHPFLILGIGRFPGFLLRTFLYRTQLDSFLSFFYRTVEVSGRLWQQGVAFGFDRVHEYLTGVVVFVLRLHVGESFAKMRVAVVIYIVTGYECLIVA